MCFCITSVLSQTIENLEKRVELLQKKIDAENAIIKQLMSSPTEPNKKKAMQVGEPRLRPEYSTRDAAEALTVTAADQGLRGDTRAVFLESAAS